MAMSVWWAMSLKRHILRKELPFMIGHFLYASLNTLCVCFLEKLSCKFIILFSLSRSRALSTKYSSSQQEASRPFDCGQERFLIGEGSVVIVLQEIEQAKKRGAKVYAELCGYGIMKFSWHLGDAHHITQPPEDGKGAILAMSVALRHVN
ncbi:unnamed protein product [Brassica oleracea var. botrytis]|uniref:beta-ketoacyl-[acyl-carrier-protein] synthase I n=1 Tax=Brassica napus TaxID=3708 RepID=A0A816RNH6_BRANA|nr:unnamed protein product [Brassica napus]